MLLFGDEVSFAQWGSLGYTWALKGETPAVKTAGKRKGYKVWGLIELFSGRFFYRGQNERFDSEGYQAFLAQVLAQTTEHPDGTCLGSELWADGKLQAWWPGETCVPCRRARGR